MYIRPKLQFPENLFSRIYRCQNIHLAKITVHFPENLFSSIYTCQNLPLTEFTFGRNHIYLKTYRPAILFPRKFLFLETIFYSKNRVRFATYCFHCLLESDR